MRSRHLSLRARVMRQLMMRSLQHKTPLSLSTLAQERKRYSKLLIRLLPKPRGVTLRESSVGGVSVTWYEPQASIPDELIIYVHGGGFVFNHQLHSGPIARIASVAKRRVVSINYSLAPEHPFPAALNEIVSVYRTLIADIDPDSVVFAGDSAGGNLVLASLIKIRDEQLPLPAAGVALSPATDATLASLSIKTRAGRDPLLSPSALTFFRDAYRGSLFPDNPLISPLFSGLRGLPPLLIQVGSEEILYDDSFRFAEKARASGVVVTLSVGQGLWHVWYMFAPIIPESQAALSEIAAYIDDQLKRP